MVEIKQEKDSDGELQGKLMGYSQAEVMVAWSLRLVLGEKRIIGIRSRP